MTTLDDPVAEARRLVELAAQHDVALRAIGGVAVWMRAPSIRTFDPPRPIRDLDLVGLHRGARRLAEILEQAGYEPQRRFNTLAGRERLLFADARASRKLDVFLDRLSMCHNLDFRSRLGADDYTLPLADLLLTKLQIVQLTERDLADIVALLADHDVNDDGRDEIELTRILDVCCSDWGWWRTATMNLERVESWVSTIAPRPALAPVPGRAGRLRDALLTAPKSARWRARAVIGERVAWYCEPEEVRG